MTSKKKSGKKPSPKKAAPVEKATPVEEAAPVEEAPPVVEKKPAKPSKSKKKAPSVPVNPEEVEPEGFRQGLSGRTLRILDDTRDLMEKLDHKVATTGHLISAILAEKEGLSGDVFSDVNAFPEMFEEEIAALKDLEPPASGFWFDPALELIFSRARLGVEVLEAGEIEPEHVILALLSLPTGTAAEIMDEFSLDRVDLREELLAMMGHDALDCPDWEKGILRRKKKKKKKKTS